MKKIIFVILAITAFPLFSQSNTLPEALQKVISKHGGLEIWKNQHTLKFSRKNSDIKHVVDLDNRQEIITAPDNSMGYDGENYWSSSDEGKPKFMINLHFYFLAMPFVLADNGISYDTNTPPLHFEGVDYPGIKISYDKGVGVADKDNYIIFYNPSTYQMEWLAYTVTYFKDKVLTQYSIRKYNNWKDFQGMLLPTETQSYKHDNFKITEKKGKPAVFDNIELSKEKAKASLFVQPKK